MKNILIKLANWIFAHYTIRLLPLSTALVELARQARVLAVCEDLTHPGESGEYKRHQVYAKLLKSFPQADKQDLAFAIELGLRGVK